MLTCKVRIIQICGSSYNILRFMGKEKVCERFLTGNKTTIKWTISARTSEKFNFNITNLGVIHFFLNQKL